MLEALIVHTYQTPIRSIHNSLRDFKGKIWREADIFLVYQGHTQTNCFLYEYNSFLFINKMINGPCCQPGMEFGCLPATKYIFAFIGWTEMPQGRAEEEERGVRISKRARHECSLFDMLLLLPPAPHCSTSVPNSPSLQLQASSVVFIQPKLPCSSHLVC